MLLVSRQRRRNSFLPARDQPRPPRRCEVEPLCLQMANPSQIKRMISVHAVVKSPAVPVMLAEFLPRARTLPLYIGAATTHVLADGLKQLILLNLVRSKKLGAAAQFTVQRFQLIS